MLHILTGAHCNNHCVFCMESDREGRRRHVGSQTPDDIRRFIETYADRDEILFTSGEPTLNPDLERYVVWAREAGYRTIALISNGRRLAQPKFAAAMVRLGINKFTLSIHGHTSEIHDALTRSPRAFEQTLKGLANLAAIRRRGHRFDVHTSTVVVRANLPHLGEVHRLLRRFDVDRMVFNVMMVKGGGAERFAELMPRYSEVAERLRTLTSGLSAEELLRISVADVPRCTVDGLPVEVLGDQERFDQFETLGSLGIADTDLLRLPDGERSVPLERLVERAASPVLEGDDSYYVR
jgi:MoaA/NifB/PqqE/SkfB family radical SAM enzyme